jgi:hypothetical protein
MRYIKSVRFSEQAVSSIPHVNGRIDGRERHSRDRLVEHADRVQAAVYALIRDYETTTGHSIIRLEYNAQARRITLDALPLSE